LVFCLTAAAFQSRTGARIDCVAVEKGWLGHPLAGSALLVEGGYSNSWCKYPVNVSNVIDCKFSLYGMIIINRGTVDNRITITYNIWKLQHKSIAL